jgi:hypothetical protein
LQLKVAQRGRGSELQRNPATVEWRQWRACRAQLASRARMAAPQHNPRS